MTKDVTIANGRAYGALYEQLLMAYNQAATGKGKERHANELPFTEQPLFKVIALVGTGFAAGQAVKKITEAAGQIDKGNLRAAHHELLGAIVYTAAMAIAVEQKIKAMLAEE